MTRVPPRPRCALCHPHSKRGPASGGGSGWSSAARFVSTELYRARVFLDSASWRGMTRVPPRLRCALCHPTLDAGSRESRWEIYLRSLLQELLDSASWRGIQECHPHVMRGPASGGGRGWSSAARFVRPEIYPCPGISGFRVVARNDRVSPCKMPRGAQVARGV